jgi:hypothetical protein
MQGVDQIIPALSGCLSRPPHSPLCRTAWKDDGQTMATETLKRSCGHETEVQLSGPTRNRERMRARLATMPCRECARAAQRAAVEEAAVAQGLPELAGTPKQIAWAQTIRHEILARVACEREELAAAGRRENASEERYAQMLKEFDGWAAKLRGQRKAWWWIDRRDAPVGHLLAEMMGVPRLEAELAEWRRDLKEKQVRYAALERARLGPVRPGPRSSAEDEVLPAPMSDEELALVEACREAQSQVDQMEALIAVVKGRQR